MVETRRTKAAAVQDSAVKDAKSEPPAPQTPTKRGRRGRPPKTKPAVTPSTPDKEDKQKDVRTNEADSFLEKEESTSPPRTPVKKEPAPKRRASKRSVNVPAPEAAVHPEDPQPSMNTPEEEPEPEAEADPEPETAVQEEEPERGNRSPSPPPEATSIPDSESMDIADSESEQDGVEAEIEEEAPTTSMASTSTSLPEVSDEIRVDVEQPLPGLLPTWEKTPEKPTTDNTHQLSSPTIRRPRIHFLHPAYNSFAASELVSPQPPPPPPPPPSEPTMPMRETENNSFSMGFKPMAFKSAAKMGLKSNPLLKPTTVETETETSEESPTMVSPLAAATPKRSSMFGSTVSGVLPPPQMVELPKLSFFNMPASTPSTSSSSETLLPETTPIVVIAEEEKAKSSKLSDAEIVALKAKAEKVAQDIARRQEEERQKEEKEEQEKRREDREKRHKKEEERAEQKRHEEEQRRNREREKRKEEERKVREEAEKAKEAEKVEKMREEDMKIPEFELISECKFLTRNAAKKKTESLICECHRTGGNCSDNTCVNRAMLTECPSSCPAKCKNQRFAKRKYASVEAFHTGTAKGCGLRALKDIKKGRFIIEYVGEVVERDDYEKRKMKYAADKKHKHHYLCDTGIYTIDATVYGNPSRFVNHSCDPNAICEKWSVPRTPGDVNRVGFFAKRNIKAGEEITFDYQFVNYGRDAQQCFCGASSCTGWIGQKPEEYSSDEENDDLVTTRYINMDEEEEEKLEELESLAPHERIELIDDMLADLVIRNKKCARKVITIAAKMTSHAQRESLIKEIFSADTSLGTQSYYAKEGMATLMGEWLDDDELSLANLRLVQSVLQALHGDVFVACAKSDRFLLEMVTRWLNASMDEWADVNVVVEAMVVFVVEEGAREYAQVGDAVQNEIVANFNRVKEMAFRLNHHWFNRSVSFKIPKKVREPAEATSSSSNKEVVDVQKQTSSSSSSHHDPYRSSSPPFQRHHHTNSHHSSYYERESHPRFFNNGNDVHQYRFAGYHGNNYKENYQRRIPYPREASSSSYRDRRSRFGRRSRSRTSRSPSPQLYKRRKLEEQREQMQRARSAERKTSPLDERTPGSTGSAERSRVEMSKMPSVEPARAPMPPSYEVPPHQPHPVPYPMPGYEAYGMYDPSTGMYMYHHPGAGYYPPPPYPPHPHPQPAWTMETLPTMEKLGEIYDRATIEELAARLEIAQRDVEQLHARIARKRAEMEAVEAARIRAEEEVRRQEALAARTKHRHVWAKAKAGNGEIYYYNKVTKETQWTPPTAEQGVLDPNDRTASPDTTVVAAEEDQHQRVVKTEEPEEPAVESEQAPAVAVEEPVVESREPKEEDVEEEEERPRREGSRHRDHRDRHHRHSHHREQLHSRDHHHREHREHRDHHRGHTSERRIREFKQELERVVKPVVCSYLRKVRDATPDKTQWLIKTVAKEMYKRESAQGGFEHRITENTEKKVRNYTKSLLDRKLKSDDLWKGYSDR